MTADASDPARYFGREVRRARLAARMSLADLGRIIGYHASQSRSTSKQWVGFVEGSTPRELELFGFPPPGHPIWDAALVDATAVAYPGLDVEPWRAALDVAT